MTENTKLRKSFEFYKQAQRLFPYGTQLFSRQPKLGPFGQAPIYFEKAKHGHIWEVGGNEFIGMAFAFGDVYTCFTHTDTGVDRILATTEETLAIIKKALEANNVDAMLKCPIRQVGFKRLV
jgi:glutamate-1-semialdehyde aminotransferase